MAIMKKGTFVVLDKNLKNVCVGDKTCLRSELLNTKERLRQALKR